jgi:dihydrofolate reductase
MGSVVIDMSMSLDGYIAAPNDDPTQGLGEDASTTGRSPILRCSSGCTARAVIMGRRSYDSSIEAWGGRGPLGDVPCLVVTHRPFTDADPVFAVVTDGIEVPSIFEGPIACAIVAV